MRVAVYYMSLYNTEMQRYLWTYEQQPQETKVTLCQTLWTPVMQKSPP